MSITDASQSIYDEQICSIISLGFNEEGFNKLKGNYWCYFLANHAQNKNLVEIENAVNFDIEEIQFNKRSCQCRLPNIKFGQQLTRLVSTI